MTDRVLWIRIEVQEFRNHWYFFSCFTRPPAKTCPSRYTLFHGQISQVSIFLSSSVMVNVYREHNLDGAVGKTLYGNA
jgi:hypothetical protein